MTYAEKLRNLADLFERKERELGYQYALTELRGYLNALSNQALYEQQKLREETT